MNVVFKIFFGCLQSTQSSLAVCDHHLTQIPLQMSLKVLPSPGIPFHYLDPTQRGHLMSQPHSTEMIHFPRISSHLNAADKRETPSLKIRHLLNAFGVTRPMSLK